MLDTSCANGIWKYFGFNIVGYNNCLAGTEVRCVKG